MGNPTIIHSDDEDSTSSDYMNSCSSSASDDDSPVTPMIQFEECHRCKKPVDNNNTATGMTCSHIYHQDCLDEELMETWSRILSDVSKDTKKRKINKSRVLNKMRGCCPECQVSVGLSTKMQSILNTEREKAGDHLGYKKHTNGEKRFVQRDQDNRRRRLIRLDR